MGFGRSHAGEVVDPVEHDFRQMAIVGYFAVREDVRLSPTRMSLLHTVERTDRFQDVLRVSGLDGNQDVRSGRHLHLQEDECNR